jgi:hypothetical protein
MTEIPPHRHRSDGVPIHALHPEETGCLGCPMPRSNAIHDEKRVAEYEARIHKAQAEHRTRVGDTDTDTTQEN